MDGEFPLLSGAEEQSLAREVDAEALERWQHVRDEIKTELEGYAMFAEVISRNPSLSDHGKREEVAKLAQQHLDQLSKIEALRLSPLANAIRDLEQVFAQPERSTGDVVLRYLQHNEIRSQLSRLDPGELRAIYLDAIDSGDDELAEAIESWPTVRLRPLPREETDAGRRQRQEKRHPQEAAKLAQLQRLQASYQSLLQAARHQLGLRADGTLNRLASGDGASRGEG
jgi:hypothetical protein